AKGTGRCVVVQVEAVIVVVVVVGRVVVGLVLGMTVVVVVGTVVALNSFTLAFTSNASLLRFRNNIRICLCNSMSGFTVVEVVVVQSVDVSLVCSLSLYIVVDDIVVLVVVGGFLVASDRMISALRSRLTLANCCLIYPCSAWMLSFSRNSLISICISDLF